jgi:hypothetical protein
MLPCVPAVVLACPSPPWTNASAVACWPPAVWDRKPVRRIAHLMGSRRLSRSPKRSLSPRDCRRRCSSHAPWHRLHRQRCRARLQPVASILQRTLGSNSLSALLLRAPAVGLASAINLARRVKGKPSMETIRHLLTRERLDAALRVATLPASSDPAGRVWSFEK